MEKCFEGNIIASWIMFIPDVVFVQLRMNYFFCSAEKL